MNNKAIVIVGAGEAGVRAALELRAQGWSGGIALIGGEPRLPYERPPLSKQHLLADEAPAVIANENALLEAGISFIRGVPAVRIHREARRVELADGSELPYERLLLATGAAPRRLAVPGDGAHELLYLRRYEDVRPIRDRLQPGRRIAVIGGGFIGLETAAGAIARGCEVTLIEAAPRILMRGVPPQIAELTKRLHRDAGVGFHIGAAIASIDRSGGRLAIRLADGRRVIADAAIAGIGAVPDTALAEACGLAVDNGIRTDERLTTSDPDIFAAGDCCSFPHPLYGGRRIRLESWRNARDQGAHAAAAMLGAAQPYAALPWFWSDQYDRTLLVAGLPDAADRIVTRDLGASGKLFFHLAEDGHLTAASAFGPSDEIAKPFRQAEMLVERQPKPAPERLADPAVRLKQLLHDQEAS